MSEKESFWKWLKGNLMIGLFTLFAGFSTMCLMFSVAMLALGDVGGFAFFVAISALFFLGAEYVYWRKNVRVQGGE